MSWEVGRMMASIHGGWKWSNLKAKSLELNFVSTNNSGVHCLHRAYLVHWSTLSCEKAILPVRWACFTCYYYYYSALQCPALKVWLCSVHGNPWVGCEWGAWFDIEKDLYGMRSVKYCYQAKFELLQFAQKNLTNVTLNYSNRAVIHVNICTISIVKTFAQELW